MRATKLTSAPHGFEYYRVCDSSGVCRVVRGRWAAQHMSSQAHEPHPEKTVIKQMEWE